MLRHVIVWLWIFAGLAGCAAAGSGGGGAQGPTAAAGGGGRGVGEADATFHGKASDAEGRDGGGSAASGGVLAYVSGRPITSRTLMPGLLEVAGGPALAEEVLRVALERRLESAGVRLTDEMVQREAEILRQTLAPDEDEAARLLNQLRESRGLGERRFADLLWRNAALRVLVADRVQVSEAARQREFRLRHGPAARVRLIMVDTLSRAQELRQQAAAQPGPGAFGELAALHSTDPSAAAGGLLPWIRPDDGSFPAVLRQAVDGLEVGQVSTVLTLDGGFALVRLEERRPAEQADYAAEEGDLDRTVRRQAERLLMQQLARELSRGADVVVLDPTLRRQWERQREALGPLQ